MQVKNKRVLKNGAIGGYVRQSDGSYRWRIIGHVKKRGGVLTESEQTRLLLSVKNELENLAFNFCSIRFFISNSANGFYKRSRNNFY